MSASPSRITRSRQKLRRSQFQSAVPLSQENRRQQIAGRQSCRPLRKSRAEFGWSASWITISAIWIWRKNTAAARQSLQAKSVTDVLGTKCYRCVRCEQPIHWRARRDLNSRPTGSKFVGTGYMASTGVYAIRGINKLRAVPSTMSTRIYRRGSLIGSLVGVYFG